MEYDSHTMLYIIPKKDEYIENIYNVNEEYKSYISAEYKFELSDEYKFELSDEDEYGYEYEFKNDEDGHLSINNKYKVKIRILGEYFCRNNKNKGKLIINNKKSEIKEFINIENINKEQIKIKMLLNNNLYNKSYMFKDCKTLLELKINNNLEYIEDNINFDINNIELENNENNINCWEDEETNLNKSLEFYGDNGNEDNITFINNISTIKKYNEENNKDSLLEYLKLFKLEDNYVNLKYMFYNCSTLSSL